MLEDCQYECIIPKYLSAIELFNMFTVYIDMIKIDQEVVCQITKECRVIFLLHVYHLLDLSQHDIYFIQNTHKEHEQRFNKVQANEHSEELLYLLPSPSPRNGDT